MYCPQCGQEQASSEMRFCSRCGFPLGGVLQLLAQGGVLSEHSAPQRGLELSARQKGTRQGLMLMFSTLLIVPVVSLLSVFIVGGEPLLIPLAALLTFVGGLLRIIYARLYEDDTPGVKTDSATYASPLPPQLNARMRGSALPPPRNMPVSDFTSRRVNTAELVQPPSVTDHTTRLLDEEKASRSE